jgi:Uncharacterised nucleotidyltransferase
VRLLTTPVSVVAQRWLVHQRVRAVLGLILPLFERAGIACLVVKGASLVHQLERDVISRPLADIDLRVTIGNFEKSSRILESLSEKATRYGIYKNMVAKIEGQWVDLEATIGPPFLTALTVEDFLARSVSVEGLPAPCITDHALLLIVNAFKDGGDTPEWTLRDTIEIAAHPAFEPHAFVNRALAGRAHTIAGIVVKELSAQSDAWMAVHKALGASPRPLYAELAHAAKRLPHANLLRRSLLRLGSDHSGDRVRALANAALWDLRHGIVRRRDAAR